MPELLAARMPELPHEAAARLIDQRRRSAKPGLVRVVVPGDDGAVGQGLRIDRDDLGDQESRPTAGARRQEVDPAIRDAMSGPVVGECRGKRQAVAELAITEPKWR